MPKRENIVDPRRGFPSISQDDLPHGRRGKHHDIIADLLRDLTTLSDGRALKIPLKELPDTKANIRSALNRAARQRKLEIATSSDERHLYIWKPNGKS
ncbi:MAG TPA: hypothetical protein VFU86_00380 [Terriglobales bacterium]|nr:hypothetical protein [Terriglobales bacterium]